MLGWTPCLDADHTHPEAGQGTVLHPPSGDPYMIAPAIPVPYGQWQERGFGGPKRWRGSPKLDTGTRKSRKSRAKESI
jgi:hypothetical protein